MWSSNLACLPREHRDERRGHGFGAGTKVKAIIERDALSGPSLSNPGGALGDDALAPQNDGGHAETFAFPAEYRLQDGINIDRVLPSIFPSGRSAGLNVSNLGASLMFYSGPKTGLELCERRISFSDGQVVKQ